VGEAAGKVNGREVYAWAAMDALLSLGRALEACKDEPAFVVEGGPRHSWALRELGLQYYHEAFGDGSRSESSFSSLKRTRTSFNNINARRSRIASLCCVARYELVVRRFRSSALTPGPRHPGHARRRDRR